MATQSPKGRRRPVVFVYSKSGPNTAAPHRLVQWERKLKQRVVSVVELPGDLSSSDTGTCTETQPSSEDGWDSDGDD